MGLIRLRAYRVFWASRAYRASRASRAYRAYSESQKVGTWVWED